MPETKYEINFSYSDDKLDWIHGTVTCHENEYKKQLENIKSVFSSKFLRIYVNKKERILDYSNME